VSSRRHRALVQRKYRRLFSSNGPTKPGPKGPGQEVIAAVVDMKQRNPIWGCLRIAKEITLTFGIPINKDVVRSTGLLYSLSSPSCAKTRPGVLRGFSVVEPERAAKLLMAPHRACSRQRRFGRNELVAQTLVWPFVMTMMDERADGNPEVRFAEWHDSVQALGFDR
jgi:hypothetical protein